MKRFVSVVLSIVMLSVMCLTVSAANDSATFTLTANDAKAGETVTVAVVISEESYFTNATLYLHYDPAVVEYVSDSLGAVAPASAMYMSNNFAEEGYVKAAYVTVSGLKKGGELLVFEFKALSDAAAQFSLSFDECVGVDDTDREFSIDYTVVPCTINNNGEPLPTTTTDSETVTTTTVEESVTTTTVTDDETVTTTKGEETATTTTKNAAQTTTTTKKVSDEKVPDEDTPKTGDSSVAFVAIVVCAAAMAVVVTMMLAKKARD